MIMMPSTVNPLRGGGASPCKKLLTPYANFACACVCGDDDYYEDYYEDDDGGSSLTVRSSDATIDADNTTRGMMISRRRRPGGEAEEEEEVGGLVVDGRQHRVVVEKSASRRRRPGGEAEEEEEVGGLVVDGRQHRVVVEKSAIKASEVAVVACARGSADEEEHRATSKTKVAASSTVGANKATDVNKEKRRIADKTKNAAKLAMKKVTSFGASSIFKCNKKKNPNENDDDARCHH
jgi:hypothetical protein